MEVVITLGERKIWNSEYEKLIGIKLDTKLNFNEYLNDINKSSRKVNAFSRVVPYMSLSKRKILMNSFFNSQWNKINQLHERCMRQYMETKLCPLKNLEQNKSASKHTRDLQMLAIEMRSNSYFAAPNVKSVFHGKESISYLDPEIWDTVPLELKELTSLNPSKKGN